MSETTETHETIVAVLELLKTSLDNSINHNYISVELATGIFTVIQAGAQTYEAEVTAKNNASRAAKDTEAKSESIADREDVS